jgi:hypothetical protein
MQLILFLQEQANEPTGRELNYRLVDGRGEGEGAWRKIHPSYFFINKILEFLKWPKL